MGKPVVSFLTACLLVFVTPSTLPVVASSLVSMPRIIAIDLEGKFSLADAVWSGGSGSSEIWACGGPIASSDGVKTDSQASQSLQYCFQTFGTNGVGFRPQGIIDARFIASDNSIRPVSNQALDAIILVSRVTVSGEQLWVWSAPSVWVVDFQSQAAEIAALRASYQARHLGQISASVARSAGDSLMPPRYTLEISHALNEQIASGMWQGPEFYFSGAQFWLCPTVPPRFMNELTDVGCLETAQFRPPTQGPQIGGLSYRNVALEYGSFDIEPIEQMRRSAHFEIARLGFENLTPPYPRAEIYSGWYNINVVVTRPVPLLEPSVGGAPSVPSEASPPTAGFTGPLVSRLERAGVKVGEASLVTLHGKRLGSISSATLGGKPVRLGPTVKNGTKEQRQIFFTGVYRAGPYDLILETLRGRLTLARAITVLP